MRKYILAMLFVGAATQAALAADMEVKVEIPRLTVAEYHRPYAAVWIERADNSVAANLAVWYDLKKKDKEGEKWLKDMRQWWRRTGRELQMPVDGVSSATRAPGLHALNVSQGNAPLGDLVPGSYKLVVEAAREVGGREVLSVPFQWPPQKAESLKAQGTTELGVVEVNLKP